MISSLVFTHWPSALDTLVENSQPDTAADHRQRHDRNGEIPGRQWGDFVTASGEISWPSMGIFPWPPTGECRHRIQPKSVECFGPKIKVAIDLRPDPLARMTEM